MPQRISKHTLYLNADRSAFVAEDDPAATFLFVREGSQVNEADAARLEKAGVDMKPLKTTDHEVPHPRDLHDAEYPTGAPAVPPVADTPKAKAAPAETKAKKAPPEDK